jgi:drug/metabolite transporter (DMT)-like permease
LSAVWRIGDGDFSCADVGDGSALTQGTGDPSGMDRTRSQYHLGIALVIAAAVAWSTAGLFTRALTVNTPTILFWRGVFGAGGMVLIVLFAPGFGRLGSFRKLGRPGWAYAALTALSMLLFISALRTTTVAHVAIITAIVPFVAAWLAWVTLREAPGKTAVVASMMALVGVAIMVGVSGDGTVIDDALAVLMAICMGGMILLSRRYPGIPALPATCVASLLSALATLPFATLGGISAQDLGLLVLFGIVNQVLGFGLFALGARLLPPMETALIVALDAPLAPLWVWLVFVETPSLFTLLGGGLVLIAVFGHIAWHSALAKRAP